MAGPITWRNVSGPSLNTGAGFMSGAVDSLNAGFSNLQNALTQRQQAAGKAEDKLKTDNLENFYSQMQSMYRTPEAFQEAQASGAINKLVSGFGPNIDPTKVRQFVEARPGVLMDRVRQEQQFKTGNQEFEAKQAEREWVPTKDRLMAMANSDDPDLRRSAAQALSIYGDNGMLGTGNLASDFVGKNRDAVRFGFEGNSEKRAEAAHIDNLANSTDRRATSAKQRELTEAQLSDIKDRRDLANLLGEVERVSQGQEVGEDGMPVSNLRSKLTQELAAGSQLPSRVVAAALTQSRAADTAAFDAFAEHERKTGILGPDSIGNPTAALEAMNTAIAARKFEPDDAELVSIGVGEMISKGVPLKKGTKLSDGSSLEEDITVYPTSNIVSKSIAATDGLTGYNFGIQGDVEGRIKDQILQPAYLRAYAARMKSDQREKFLSAMPKPGSVQPNQKANKRLGR